MADTGYMPADDGLEYTDEERQAMIDQIEYRAENNLCQQCGEQLQWTRNRRWTGFQRKCRACYEDTIWLEDTTKTYIVRYCWYNDGNIPDSPDFTNDEDVSVHKTLEGAQKKVIELTLEEIDLDNLLSRDCIQEYIKKMLTEDGEEAVSLFNEKAKKRFLKNKEECPHIYEGREFEEYTLDQIIEMVIEGNIDSLDELPEKYMSQICLNSYDFLLKNGEFDDAYHMDCYHIVVNELGG
jgi:hypothetical protein